MSKAKYYPRIDLIETVTPFGAIETNYPSLYKTPIKSTDSSVINSVEIDALDCLKVLWGENILQARDFVYILVSGKVPPEYINNGCSEEDYYRRLFNSYYSRYPAFRNAVDLEFFFGTKGIPFIQRFMQPIRERINRRIDLISRKVESLPTGKVLMTSNDYIYAAFRTTITEEFAGGRIIKNV